MRKPFAPAKNVVFAFTFAVTIFGAGKADALPQLQDYWRLSCAPNGVTNKVLNKAQTKMANAADDVASGIATLNYACIQSALEMKQFQTATQKFQEAGGKGKAPVVNHNASMQYAKNALAKLNSAVKTHKTDPEVLYHLGLAFAIIGDDWAVNRLDDAVRAGAGSETAQEAQITLAEYYFDKKGPAAAMESYNKVLKGKKGFAQSYARYKLGWVAYVNGAQAKNREAMRGAITSLAKLSKQLQNVDEGPEAGLDKALKEDILAMAVDYGDQAEAQRILVSVGAKEVYAIFLDRLAYAKIDAKQPADAYKLFAAELKETPRAKGNLPISINLAALAVQMGNVPLLVGNVKSIIGTYVNEKAAWRKKQKPADLKKADKQIEGLVFDYATGLDQEGRKTNAPATLQAADDMYGLFLKTFPKSEKAYDVRFYDGQLNFVMKKFVAAAQGLLAMVTASPKGKNTKDGLDIMVTAVQSAIDADKTTYTLPKPGQAKNEIKIPPLKKLYADCLDMYVKYNPRNDNAPAMRYAAGTVYYDFGHYKDGNKHYFAVIKSAPQNQFAKPAAARIFEYYKAQKSDEQYDKVKENIAAVPNLKAAPELAAYFAEVKKPKAKKNTEVAGETGGDSEDTGDVDGSDDSDAHKKKSKKAKVVKEEAEDGDEP